MSSLPPGYYLVPRTLRKSLLCTFIIVVYCSGSCLCETEIFAWTQCPSCKICLRETYCADGKQWLSPAREEIHLSLFHHQSPLCCLQTDPFIKTSSKVLVFSKDTTQTLSVQTQVLPLWFLLLLLISITRMSRKTIWGQQPVRRGCLVLIPEWTVQNLKPFSWQPLQSENEWLFFSQLK